MGFQITTSFRTNSEMYLGFCLINFWDIFKNKLALVCCFFPWLNRIQVSPSALVFQQIIRIMKKKLCLFRDDKTSFHTFIIMPFCRWYIDLTFNIYHRKYPISITITCKVYSTVPLDRYLITLQDQYSFFLLRFCVL